MEAASGERPRPNKRPPPAEVVAPMGPARSTSSSLANSDAPRDAVLAQHGASRVSIEMPVQAPVEPAPQPTYGHGAGAAAAAGASGGGGRDGRAAAGMEGRDGGQAFPYWNKPSALSGLATVLCDLGTWAAYFGVGIPLEDYRLSGMIAAGVAAGGVSVQVYRYIRERSLRVLWKMQPTLLSATW